MSLIVIDGPHHTGKTTLVEATCGDLPQPKSQRPEDLEVDLLGWVQRYALSEDIAVFDHFPLFSYPVKVATERADARFWREYKLSNEVLDTVRASLGKADQMGRLLLVHASLPEAKLSGQEEAREAFYREFAGWPNHYFYDYTDRHTSRFVKQRIKDFIDAHSG